MVSRSGYTPGPEPYNLGVAGAPAAEDYDEDELADPAVTDAGGSSVYGFPVRVRAWRTLRPEYLPGRAGGGDYDGDGRADGVSGYQRRLVRLAFRPRVWPGGSGNLTVP